jgi:predicted TIM-barrel fold metal-dependent hydrolase
MWQSDFPHNPSTYPRSRDVINHIFKGVPQDLRAKVLYKNVLELYKEEPVFEAAKSN